MENVKKGRDVKNRLVELTGISPDKIHVRFVFRRGFEVIVGDFSSTFEDSYHVSSYDDEIEKDLVKFIKKHSQ